MSRIIRPRARAMRRGFTMLEMIVAVAISTIVVGGLYSLFNLQSKEFVYQDIRMSMHQNLRFATDVISRSIRMAGYGTGGGVRGPMGWDGSSVSDADILPAVISWDAWNGSHDAITLVYADPALEMNTTVDNVESCGTSTLTFDMNMKDYDSLIANYQTGELLQCWDYAPAGGPLSYMWTISSDGDSGSGQIGVDSNSGVYADFDAKCASSDNLPPIMNCSRATVVTYYIDDDDTDGIGPGSTEHPVLMMDLDFDFPDSGPADDDIPLVDDIEDLQFAYCRADDDCSDSSSWVDSLTADEGMEVWMVRVSISARTPRPDPRDVHVEPRPALENHGASSTDDGYYRELLVTRVAVRNLRVL